MMVDGIYYLSVTTPNYPDYTHPVVGWVKAYDASGKKVFDSRDYLKK